MRNLKKLYRNLNKDKKDSVVLLKQQGEDVLYIIRKMFTTGRYCLSKCRYCAERKKFVVDMSRGDFQSFAANPITLEKIIPRDGVF